MCKCTPNKRTPFCGAVGCEWPEQENTNKFKILKAAANPVKGNQIFLRITEQIVLDAFNLALKDSGKTAAKLTEEMIKHCLKDARLS